MRDSAPEVLFQVRKTLDEGHGCFNRALTGGIRRALARVRTILENIDRPTTAETRAFRITVKPASSKWKVLHWKSA
jgi:hypothetical protein